MIEIDAALKPADLEEAIDRLWELSAVKIRSIQNEYDREQGRARPEHGCDQDHQEEHREGEQCVDRAHEHGIHQPASGRGEHADESANEQRYDGAEAGDGQ